MMWVLTSMTVLALVVIAVVVNDIARVPAIAKAPAAARPAALSAPEPATAATSARPRRAEVSASASTQGPQVTDSSSGLSYRLLSAPWRPGCPSALETPMFSWSAGEGTIAGPAFIAGSATDWYGDACSGLLKQQFRYSSAADLEPAATSLADALDLAYYSGLPHYLAVQDSSGVQVSGHRAWVVTFLMAYPAADSEGLAWTSETGAVVLVDRGPGQAPAVFYASVPNNLGTSEVGVLLGSLRLG